jgi:hypothetical protein
MSKKEIIEQIISKERLEPYLRHHNNDLGKAISHYKSNISISEAFYPLLSILEIGLRNSIDFQLTKRFSEKNWFECSEFLKIASSYQKEKILEAKSNIVSQKKEITTGRIISELSFGFWTSLFDARFEMTLWKSLRLVFRNCPKQIRKRKTMSSKFNGIRRLRNRIFHHEPISWNLNVLYSYRNAIFEGIEWLDEELMDWISELNHLNKTVKMLKTTIE